jgi:hypothetical protein
MLRFLIFACGSFVSVLAACAADDAAAPKAAPKAQPVADEIAVAKTDWPWWRGPRRDGVADADQQPPLRWSEMENILWKAPVPGRGHGSPTVVGDQVFLASADEEQEIQWVLCYDRNTGRELWRTVVHQGRLVKKGNRKASHASSSVACDGERLFINFLNGRPRSATTSSIRVTAPRRRCTGRW